jgi:hypothetical protein
MARHCRAIFFVFLERQPWSQAGMTLDTLANIADIVGAFLVITGVIFGLIQIQGSL